jgi:hypothetical protein
MSPVYHVHKWTEIGGLHETFRVLSLADAVPLMGAGHFVLDIDENGNLRRLTEAEERELDAPIRKAD